MKANNLSRRNFLQVAALTAGALSTGAQATAQVKGTSLALVGDPADPIVSTSPVAWTLQEIASALTQKGVRVQRVNTVDQAADSDFYIVASGSGSATLSNFHIQTGSTVANKAEANALVS